MFPLLSNEISPVRAQLPSAWPTPGTGLTKMGGFLQNQYGHHLYHLLSPNYSREAD